MCVHALSNLLNEFEDILKNGVCFFATSFATYKMLLLSFNNVYMFLKGYPLEAKTAPKN